MHIADFFSLSLFEFSRQKLVFNVEQLAWCFAKVLNRRWYDINFESLTDFLEHWFPLGNGALHRLNSSVALWTHGILSI